MELQTHDQHLLTIDGGYVMALESLSANQCAVIMEGPLRIVIAQSYDDVATQLWGEPV